MHLSHDSTVTQSLCPNRLPESPGDVPEYPLFISIGDWLDSIKMSQYKNNFMAAGFTTLDSISTMNIEWVGSVCKAQYPLEVYDCNTGIGACECFAYFLNRVCVLVCVFFQRYPANRNNADRAPETDSKQHTDTTAAVTPRAGEGLSCMRQTDGQTDRQHEPVPDIYPQADSLS